MTNIQPHSLVDSWTGLEKVVGRFSSLVSIAAADAALSSRRSNGVEENGNDQ
jgi:hypothetical protein